MVCPPHRQNVGIGASGEQYLSRYASLESIEIVILAYILDGGPTVLYPSVKYGWRVIRSQ
jgi:hypothetical protein